MFQTLRRAFDREAELARTRAAVAELDRARALRRNRSYLARDRAGRPRLSTEGGRYASR